MIKIQDQISEIRRQVIHGIIWDSKSAVLHQTKMLRFLNKQIYANSSNRLFVNAKYGIGQNSFLSISNAKLQFKTIFSSSNSNFTRSLNGLKKDSIVSSHLCLFIRRQRFLANRSKSINQNEKLKVPINKSSIKRLLKLAKPERYKIAGKSQSNLVRYLMRSFEIWYFVLSIFFKRLY